MTEMATKEFWIPWRVKQPTEPGVYWWRLSSNVLKGVNLIFAARLVSCNDQAVPPFFKWDGWKVIVPPCEWKPAPEVECSKYEELHLSIENLELLPCPYCGEIPRLSGIQAPPGGGVVIAASPANYNSWRFKCCEWGSSPTRRDPREIERIRREAFARVMEAGPCPKN